MQKKIQQVRQEILDQIAQLRDEVSLQRLEQQYFGKKGTFTAVAKEIKNIPPSERKEAGQAVQAARQDIEQALSRARQQLGGNENAQAFDVTLPGTARERGTLHPITQALYKLEDIFRAMGFLVADGPELESEWYNFDALNIPATHPARDMQDTFFVKGAKQGAGLVLRTHTSPVQVRAMHEHGAPLRVVSLGKVFRNEATDTTHNHTFHQIEGLVVDTDISIGHLIATLKDMMSRYYGRAMKIRLRPGYFPFVEPGFEIDIASDIKKGGWMEMLGAGLVHPNVLRAGGIDPNKYSGFAFGTGVERLVMLEHGVTDIRLFHSGDLHFLKQF